jgi:hypothetical protein
LIFSFFFVINIASNGGHFDANDGIEYFLVTESMVLKHSAKLHPDLPSIQKLHFNIRGAINTATKLETGQGVGINSTLKPTYIAHCCLLSALAIPFYYAGMFFEVSPQFVVAIFVNPLILALTSIVIFRFSLEIYDSKKVAFIASLIFGVCSFAWSYGTSFLPQPLQTLLVITSVYFVYLSLGNNVVKYGISYGNKNKRIYFAGLAGLFLGLSIYAHPSSLILIPGLIAYTFLKTKHNKKTLYSLLIVLGIVLFSAGLTNYWRFGSFTHFGYGRDGSLFYHQGWQGLLGLLVSPGSGIIFFVPIVILAPIGFLYLSRKNRGLSLLFAYIIIVVWLFFGTIDDPSFKSGGWNGIAWGPRYLMVTLPFLIMAVGALVQNLNKLASRPKLLLKFSIVILCVVGFYINLLGVLVWYLYGYGYSWQREQLWKVEAIFKQNNNRGINSFDLMTWIPQYSPIILDMKVLMSDYLTTVQQHQNQQYNWALNGLAPCAYDIFLFCKFGIIPILSLFAVIFVLAILILREISKFSPQLFVFRLRNHHAKESR